jgi:multisubunit Na+/H+ antiporter MnhE subunit
MILITHILIAIASVVLATYLIVKPSKSLLNITYGLTAATLVSGTYLVVSTSAHLLQSCVTGLAYVGIVSVGLMTAHVKLTSVKVDSKN